MVAGLNSFDVSRWLARVPFPYGAADFRTFLPLAAPGVVWAIEDAAGFVGVVSLEVRGLADAPEDVIGYWLAEHAWGKGYATEAGRAVLDAHFSGGGGDVASGYFEDNLRSAGVLGKLGFVETGRARMASLTLGPDAPHVDLRLTAEAYRAASVSAR